MEFYKSITTWTACAASYKKEVPIRTKIADISHVVGTRGFLVLGPIRSGFPLAVLINVLFKSSDGSSTPALKLMPMAIGFVWAARLRCAKCGLRLSKKFPAGSVILLPFAKQKCPSCDEEL